MGVWGEKRIKLERRERKVGREEKEESPAAALNCWSGNSDGYLMGRLKN